MGDPAARDLVADDRAYLTRLPGPVLLDEWQRMPEVWDIVRRDVDARGERGRYLLDGATDVEGTTEVTLPTYIEEIVASGFPGIRADPPRIHGRRLDAYLDAVVQREFAEQGLSVRRPHVLRSWLAAFAAATSTTASYNAILAAATPGESSKPAKTTTIAYREGLESLWLLDEVDAWLPTGNEFARLGQAPKHQLADPALAARLLGVDAVALAVEVKLSAHVADDDVRHLSWLKARIGDDLIGSVIVTTGGYAYRRSDGVAVVPAALLGP